MGSWTFQFNLDVLPSKSRHLCPLFSAAGRGTHPQGCQVTQALFQAAEMSFPALSCKSVDTADRGCPPFKVSWGSPRQVCFQPLRQQQAKQSCRLRHMPHCFQSEHVFDIKRRAVVGVEGAEGRFKGSSALKDVNLFKVSTLRVLARFHPTQQERFCPHSGATCVEGLGCDPEGRLKETRRSPRHRHFPQRMQFPLWDLISSLRHTHMQRTGDYLLGRPSLAMGGDGCHELTPGGMNSFCLGPRAGGCWSEPEPGWTGDREKGKGLASSCSQFLASVFSFANWE